MCRSKARGPGSPSPANPGKLSFGPPPSEKKSGYAQWEGGGGSNQYLAAKLSNSFGLTFHSFSELSDIFYFSRGYIYKIDAIDTGT